MNKSPFMVTVTGCYKFDPAYLTQTSPPIVPLETSTLPLTYPSSLSSPNVNLSAANPSPAATD